MSENAVTTLKTRTDNNKNSNLYRGRGLRINFNSEP